LIQQGEGHGYKKQPFIEGNMDKHGWAINRPVLLLHLQVQPQAEMRHFFSVAEHKLCEVGWEVQFAFKNFINGFLPVLSCEGRLERQKHPHQKTIHIHLKLR